jgi:hypothetical protein
MEPNESQSEILHRIAARADSAGHVILEEAEVAFAQSGPGGQWLEPIDAGKRLYKLTPIAQQRQAL